MKFGMFDFFIFFNIFLLLYKHDRNQLSHFGVVIRATTTNSIGYQIIV